MDLGLVHHLFSKRVKQPVVVFQSDDWGFNRLGTAEALREYQRGALVELEGNMARKDSLETEEDVQLLADVLTEGGRRTCAENAAVYTCNAVTANVDFEEIVRVEGSHFVAESVETTYNRLYGNGGGGLLSLQDGSRKGYFDLQFHAWVHLQCAAWLEAYRARDPDVVLGTNLGICGVYSNRAMHTLGRSNFLAALTCSPSDEGFEELLQRWEDAYRNFAEVWGRPANSFIAPAYIWNSAVEDRLINAGVQLVQGLPYQLIPARNASFKRKYRRMRHTQPGALYTVRNCYFEPCENYSRDYVAECLQRMQTLVRWRVPVIINTHRFNYVGGMDLDHRAHGLKELKRLIASIRKQWPDAKFIGTRDLPDYMKG